MKRKGVIVTGANGYLGREICRLYAGQTRVLALARCLEKLSDLGSGNIERATYEDLPGAIGDGEVFIHSAARTAGRGNWEDYLRTNVDWTLELFEQVGDRVSLFVFISSVAAAGYSNRSDLKPLSESDPPILLEGEYYGRTKWMAETRLREKARETGTRLVILRPGLVYEARRLARTQTWIRRGFFGDPEERVPLVHLSNFLDAIDAVLSNDDVEGTFFVVDDEQPTRRELIDLEIEQGLLRYRPWRLGRAGLIVKSLLSALKQALRGGGDAGPWRECLRADLAAKRRRMRYDTTALREAAGWSPRIGLAEGLKPKSEGVGV